MNELDRREKHPRQDPVMRRRRNDTLFQPDRKETNKESLSRYRVLLLMMKAFEPVTLLIDPFVLLQDDSFMSARYHRLTNILLKDRELDIIGGTVQN